MVPMDTRFKDRHQSQYLCQKPEKQKKHALLSKPTLETNLLFLSDEILGAKNGHTVPLGN